MCCVLLAVTFHLRWNSWVICPVGCVWFVLFFLYQRLHTPLTTIHTALILATVLFTVWNHATMWWNLKSALLCFLRCSGPVFNNWYVLIGGNDAERASHVEQSSLSWLTVPDHNSIIIIVIIIIFIIFLGTGTMSCALPRLTLIFTRLFIGGEETRNYS